MADQTNAEVSDERLREDVLESCAALLETLAEDAEKDGRVADWSMMSVMAEKARAALNRRSVTSQASEGAETNALATAVDALKEWLAIWDAVCNEADPDEGVPPDWSIARLAMMPWMDPLGFDTAEYFSGYMKADLVYRARDLVRAAASPSKRVERLETDLSAEVDNMLDEHNIEGPLRDGLAYDMGLLLLPYAHAKKDLAASGNYVADDDTSPTEVTFANGRVVRLSADRTHLVIDQALGGRS